MRFNTKAMIGVPVSTKSGQSVGKVASFDFEAETGRLATLHIKTRHLVPGLMDDEVYVPWSAILEIKEDHVIIADGLIEAAAGLNLARLAKSSTAQLAKDYVDVG